MEFPQVWDMMPVLRGKPGTSSRATQALNCWAISSLPLRKNGFNGPNTAFGCFDFQESGENLKVKGMVRAEEL